MSNPGIAPVAATDLRINDQCNGCVHVNVCEFIDKNREIQKTILDVDKQIMNNELMKYTLTCNEFLNA